MGIPLVLRWLWWRLTAWGEIAAIVASSVMAPILISTVDSDAWRLLLVAVVSSAASILASWIGGPEDPEVLERFYRRAQPPGFWRGVAGANSASEDRLHRGLGAMLACAASVFALLTGIGSWLVASPAPEWLFDSRPAWIALNLLLGVGLVPVWVWLGLGDRDEGSVVGGPTRPSRVSPSPREANEARQTLG